MFSGSSPPTKFADGISGPRKTTISLAGFCQTIVRYGSAIPRMARMTIALTCNTRTRLKVNPLSRMQSPGTEAGCASRPAAHVVDRVFHTRTGAPGDDHDGS